MISDKKGFKNKTNRSEAKTIAVRFFSLIPTNKAQTAIIDSIAAKI